MVLTAGQIKELAPGAEVVLAGVDTEDDESRTQWLAARNSGIGASEIATVLGMNPFSSPLELWARKTGKAPEQPDNAFMRVGRALEPVVLEVFEETTGLVTIPAKCLLRHPDYPWMLASPDAFVPGRNDAGIPEVRVLEAKAPGAKARPYWSDDRGPAQYHIQLCQQLAVCGLDSGWLAALIGGDAREFAIVPQASDREVLSLILEAGDKFWQLVQRDMPPEAGPGDAKLIEDIVRRKPGKRARLGNEALAILERLRAVAAKKSDAEKVVKALDAEQKLEENRLRLLLGDAAVGELPGTTEEVRVATVTVGPKAGYSYSRIYWPRGA